MVIYSWVEACPIPPAPFEDCPSTYGHMTGLTVERRLINYWQSYTHGLDIVWLAIKW